ncbi:hypothetical protein ACHWQZ_G008049 [Mnemiopsis leidyi]
MPQIIGSTMLDQQSFQRPGLNDPLKCSPLSNENIIRENNSDDNSSTAEQIVTDLYDSQQFWNSSGLDDVNQVLQSLTISTNADAASNQSSSSAYSSSYSSPTSTSYGPNLGTSLHNNTISQLNNLPYQSRLNEWASNPAVNTSSWAAQSLSSPTINPPSLSRPLFNNGPTAPMAAFGNPNGWGTNLAAQLVNNNNLGTYLMRNAHAFKNMPSPGRRSNSGFGGRDSSIIPSKQNSVPRPMQFNSGNRMNETQENLNFLPASSATETMLYELLNQDSTEQVFHPSIQDSPIRKFHYDPPGEKYSRKVFVGGLPPDIDEREIHASFCHFGSLDVDWPHKSQSRAPFPPKGYAFLLFHEEYSVQALISMCKQEGGKYYYFVSSPTLKDKQVQIRPWSLQDADFVMDGSQPLDPRKTIFVGGVPRPLRSVELAVIMNKYYSGVCYAGIDVDPELKYPKGAGRVAFSNHTSYINAINNRFIQLKIGDIDKKVEVKPYVLDDQLCDECNGEHCGGKFAPFFCGHISCLRYFCEHCWSVAHTQPGREFHKPLVKEGADRSRSLNSFRW